MLKAAYLYKDALPSYWVKSSLEYRCRFFSENYWNFDKLINDNNWDSHQFVSVDTSDNIVGFLAVTIDRPCHFVHHLGAMRFETNKRYDILFAKDFKNFFDLLFDFYKYNKVNFEVCVGSPHEKMYDKFVSKYGGRIVGVRHKDFRLQDGTICDQKLYELPREDFLNSINKKQGEEK
jgi:hypothetical protein